MRKDPFWYFSVDQLWPFNFQPDISKMEYLDFYSSVYKTEDSSGNIGIKRRHGKKPIFKFSSFSPPKILVTLHLPWGRTMSPGPQRNFRNMGFHFLTPIFHFLPKPKPNEKLVSYSMKTCTWTQKNLFYP